MNQVDSPGEANPDRTAAKLKTGLRTCRLVLENYRAMLSNCDGSGPPRRAQRQGD
jgi:hypothetical protein